jgi:hypothetical protein
MKKLFIISAIAISGLIYNTASAQISIHVGFGFHPRRVVYAPAPAPVVVTPQPQVCGPVNGQPVYSDSNDDYYYLPDVGAYYDVNDQCYYYNDGGAWISAAYLPGAYRNYDWRSATRYEIRAARPYLRDDFYRSRYNGRPSMEWASNDRRFDNGYANRDFHGYDQRFDNRNYNRNDQRFDNRSDNRNDQRFDNRDQSGYNQPSNKNNNRGGEARGGNERFSQNRSQGGVVGYRMARY